MKNMKLLEHLDNVLAPNGKFDVEIFTKLFNAYCESLSSMTEPEDEEDRGPWKDSTMKHQIFDYWPTNRPKNHKNAKLWSGTNDLAWVLADYADYDPDITKELFKIKNKAKATLAVSSTLSAHFYSDVQVSKPSLTKSAKDPQAFYVFPYGVTTEHYASKPYRYVVTINEQQSLDLESLSRSNCLLFLKKAGLTKVPKIIATAPNFRTRMWDLLREHFNNPIKFQKFWLDSGYKLLKDTEGSVVLPIEPQYIVLDLNLIKSFKLDETGE